MAIQINSIAKIKQGEAAGALFLDYFIYNADIASLAAGASQSFNINIEADSSFILDKMAFSADIAGAAQTDSSRVIPLVTVQIRDSGSGRLLQSTPVNIASLAGNGELPFVLSQPRVFSASATISITFTNQSAATTYTNLQLSLIGRKVFQF